MINVRYSIYQELVFTFHLVHSNFQGSNDYPKGRLNDCSGKIWKISFPMG